MDQILEHTKILLEDLVFETYRNRLDDVETNQKAYIEHFKDMAYDLYAIHNYQSFSSIMIDIENGVWNHITLDQVDDVDLVEKIFHPITQALYISKQI
jgi:hypothetical protein